MVRATDNLCRGIAALVERFTIQDAGEWKDDDSHLKESLLPLCDGLLAFLDLEDIEKDPRNTVSIEWRGDLKAALTDSAVKLTQWAYCDFKKKPHERYSYFVTSKHMKEKPHPPPQTLISSLTLCCAAMLLQTKIIELDEDLLDRLKVIGKRLAEQLLNSQKGGWSWRSDVKPDPDELIEADIFSTYNACSALHLWRNAHFVSDINVSDIDKSIDQAVNWTIESAWRNLRMNRPPAWSEFGSHGRHRLFFQVIALSLIFEHGDYKLLAENDRLLWEGLRQIVFSDLHDFRYDFEILRYRASDLLVQVLMEERSGPYFLLRLWGTLLKNFVNDSREIPDKRLQEFLNDMRTFLDQPLQKLAMRKAYDLVIEKQGDEKRKELWERDAYRIYSTGMALKALCIFETYANIDLSAKDIAAELAEAIQDVLSSPRFAGVFSEQVLSVLRRRASLQPLFEKPAKEKGGSSGPSYSSMFDRKE